jgi:hypothetical protein
LKVNRHDGKKTFDFTLILSGQPEPTEEMAEALIEAGCDDALLGSHCGMITLDFRRESDSLRAAITAAIRDVLRADLGLRVVRVAPDELVTASEVAARLGRSKELIRLYATGKRGSGGFPPPITAVGKKTLLWRWLDIVEWMLTKNTGRETKGGKDTHDFDTQSVEDARTIGAVNAALELGRYAHDPQQTSSIMEYIEAGAGRCAVR